MPKYLVPIDMNKNEIQNAVIQKLAAAPSNPIKGLFYFNTTDNTLYVYNGTTWRDALTNGVNNYNELVDTPITNLTTNTLLSNAGIYKIIGSGVTVTVNTQSITGDETLIIYDGTNATIIKANSIYRITSTGSVINYVEANSPITGATKPKVTYDSKGLVTGGADLQASDIPDLSSLYIAATLKGANNGVAELGADGKVPSTQLPSYVDDVIEGYYYNNKFYKESTHTTEITGETGKIYVDLATNKSYRWSGTTYTEIAQANIHKYIETITGDGTTTSFSISHGLNSRDVLVNVYDATTYEDIVVNIARTSTSSLTIDFAVAPIVGEDYKVVVIA